MNQDDHSSTDAHVLSDNNVAQVQESDDSKEEKVEDASTDQDNAPPVVADKSELPETKESDNITAVSDQQNVNMEDDNSQKCNSELQQLSDNCELGGGGKKIVKFSDENLITGFAELKDPLIAGKLNFTNIVFV